MGMLKRVRKDDLRKLILQWYFEYVKHIPAKDAYHYEAEGIVLDVNTICVNLYDASEFDYVNDQESYLDNLAEHIKEMSFGNLKVVSYGCEENEDEKHNWTYSTWLNIAVKYEVID